MSKARRVVKNGAKLVRNIARSGSLAKKLIIAEAERDRYYNERQILYDQSRNMRVFLANKYLTGKGIEIGPANLPLPVPHWASVKYLDVMSEQDLYELYPGLKEHKLAHIDIVDDGETLGNVKDRSQDFIIANHFMEHTIDPIMTLKNFHRVLKKDGIVYMAVPDKAYTFDFMRPLTPIERLKKFHKNPSAAEAGKYPMYIEAAEYLEGVPKGLSKARADEMKRTNYSIHFNVWRQQDIVELIQLCIIEHGLAFDYESVVKNEHEVILILRKDPSDIEAFKRKKLEEARKAEAKIKAMKKKDKTKKKSVAKKR